jgi:4-hydroxy-tetrahydrodipicolinate synthase
MKRWYNEIPAIKNAFPEIAVMSCHDEWLLPTMFDVDGLLVGYGNMAPELLLEYLAAGKAQNYPLARKYHEQLLPITRAVYHRGSHMEGSVALKHALRARGLVDNVNVREPLKPLGDGADEEIRAAVKASGLAYVGAEAVAA